MVEQVGSPYVVGWQTELMSGKVFACLGQGVRSEEVFFVF
jgi:hypothetical protein